MNKFVDSDKIYDPLNGDIERIVEKLLRVHGEETVRKVMEKLFYKARWSDWQRVDSLINKTAKRIQHETKSKR